MAYSYEDFVNQAGDMLGNFSQYDLDLAKQHPEAGMAILQYKRDYNNAKTQEAKLLANQGANQIRNSFGSYSGGGDGSKYYYTGSRADAALDKVGSFGSFQDTTPRPADYQSSYSGNKSAILDQIGGYGSFSYNAAAPAYSNAYAQMQQKLLDSVVNRPDFSWSKETDPQWASYKKQYLREGERAQANALAQASAASGGRPSSYALTAASQAGDYYAGKLSDVLPTLYQQAYDRYLQEFQMDRQRLSDVNAQEQLDYAKYLDQLGQYNQDRSFALDSWRGNLDALQSQLGAYQQAEQQEFNEYLARLDQYNADRNFAYNVYQGDYDRLLSQYSALAGREDTLYSRNYAAEQDRYNRALAAEQTAYDRAWNEAQRDYERQQAEMALAQGQVDAMLQAGGTVPSSLLSQSGYAPEYAQLMEAYYRGQAAQASSGSSGGSRRSSGSSSSSGGSSSGSGADDYNGLFAAAQASGYPASFIANHYKEFGFKSSSGLAKAYEQWAEEMEDVGDAPSGGQQGGGAITSSAQLGKSAKIIYDGMTRSTGRASAFLDRIEKAYANGSITEAEADYLLSVQGM